MKPIIFSTPMVRAILAGRKTQTRRLIKPQPDGEIKANIPYEFYGIKTERIFTDTKAYLAPCSVGDILWVRETFCEVPYEHNHVSIKGGYITIPKYAYKADSERDYTGIWKPSIHMPREAARLFLRVLNVRVERLQDITEEGAKREGIQSYWAEPHRDVAPFIGAAKELGADLCLTRRQAFEQKWDSIYSARGYGWEQNPWVWVIEFEREEVEESEVRN